jgi:hypothetical protein
MMKTTKLSHAEALKAEIMERYNLREDQVSIELSISTADLDTGRAILADFDKFSNENKEYLKENKKADSVFGEIIHFVAVHRKDGFHGTYEGENDDE